MHNNYEVLALLMIKKYMEETLTESYFAKIGFKKIRNKLDKILFAIPSIGKKTKEIFEYLQKFTFNFKIPTLDELSKYELKINDLRPLNIDDLLGREL